MPNHLDVVFSPGIYLDRDKRAIAFVEDRLLHQESCAAICMNGNGKDYLFTNVVKRFEARQLGRKLKVLNTISSDELRDFADMLDAETEPTLCLINLRIGKDVSWFIERLARLHVTRGHSFVSFVSSYVGDVYEALQAMARPVTHSLVMLKRVPYEDALHTIAELSDRFGYYPSDDQKQDMYRWTYGHVGLLRTLYLLKRENPAQTFSRSGLLREPTVLERLHNILSDIPADKLEAIRTHRLSFLEKTFFEEFGYIDPDGKLFHPLLIPLLPDAPTRRSSTFSVAEQRVLDYLRAHPGTVISRDDIARIVWGEEEWEDKYSDWAIGQLIYRLRKKLAYSAAPVKIETVKSLGFAYQLTD